MDDPQIRFDDGAAYEEFMGKWSRLAGETFLASDIPALLGRSLEAVVLEEGDIAVLTRGKANVQRLDGRPVRRRATPISMSAEAVERNGYADPVA